MSTVGKNIQRYRRENKLTQEKLGALINKSAISIRKYESDDVAPPINVLLNIASALNVNINDLLGHDKQNKYNKLVHGVCKEAYNQVQLQRVSDHDKLDLLYKSKLNELKNTIEVQELMIKQLNEMINLKDKRIENLTNELFSLLGSGTDIE